MKISALRVVNYKGFLDSGFVELSNSWNVIVGQNNAGKTAFIEGFRLNRNSYNKPHRNIDFLRGYPYPPESKFVARMIFSRKWLQNCWLMQGGDFLIPVAANEQNLFPDPRTFWDGDDLQVELTFGANVTSASSEWPSHRLFTGNREQRHVRYRIDSDRKPFSNYGVGAGAEDSLPTTVGMSHSDRIYVFEAKRFAVGECQLQDATILTPNASNLPAVLHQLSGNPELFNEYCKLIELIFPSIKHVTIIARGSNFEVRIWPYAPSTRRDDLSIPLNESGAGVGQVLAILYVAMTMESAVIVIDEPNSFLHPGAAKKLIQILKQFPQHQYIISTHSPEVISAAQPAALHLVRFDGQKSVIETMNEYQVESKQVMLEEVGATLSDVFSADKIIWVEGPTERECFNCIAETVLGGPIPGVSFIALRNTGDLEGKQATATLDLYDALSQGGAILPISVQFSFDREGKKEAQLDDIRRRLKDRVDFLPRRMTENYFLNPSAIAKVLQNLGEAEATFDKVNEVLKRLAPEYCNEKWGTEEFFNSVDGAKLLNDIFNEISDARHEYRKVEHGSKLLRVILSEDPDSVQELIEYVKGLLDKVEKATAA